MCQSMEFGKAIPLFGNGCSVISCPQQRPIAMNKAGGNPKGNEKVLPFTKERLQWNSKTTENFHRIL